MAEYCDLSFSEDCSEVMDNIPMDESSDDELVLPPVRAGAKRRLASNQGNKPRTANGKLSKLMNWCFTLNHPHDDEKLFFARYG